MTRQESQPVATENLRAIRTAQGLTREQLAVRAGISAKTIYRIERGIARPHHATLAVLATALGVDWEGERCR
jgi:transcriptional regulator with XRE-family HTH domain